MEFCQSHMTLMEKIEKLTDKIAGVEVAIATLPEKILEKADNRYASKEVEKVIQKLMDRSDKRTYDWLKMIATAIVSFGAALLLAHYR